MNARQPTIAVVGAGLSGLTCARALSRRGVVVRVFDKARGPGGRMATRRQGEAQFDHGAQYFTVRHPSFRQQVDRWIASGVAAAWNGVVAVLERGAVSPTANATERFVGVPRMSAITRAQAAGLDLVLEARVVELRRGERGWSLRTEAGDEGPFDEVVLTVPAPQAVGLLAVAPSLEARARAVDIAPCWAAMVELATPLDVPFDGAFVHRSGLSWIARDSSKPGRPPGERWVLHAAPGWSRQRLQLERDQALPLLLEELASALGRPLPTVSHAAAHRWRFALPEEPLDEGLLHAPERGITVCGDWCAGARVEGAYLSGVAAAEQLLARLA